MIDQLTRVPALTRPELLAPAVATALRAWHGPGELVEVTEIDPAVAETGMEYGGITPIGLPASWPLLVDAAAAATERVIIGSGIRGSKLVIPGALLAALPKAEVLEDLAA